MDIIIVGCGKVGFTLVEQLSNEDHNIVVLSLIHILTLPTTPYV